MSTTEEKVEYIKCPLSSNSNNNNNKTLSGGITIIVGLLAIIAGVYAMIQPMNQRLDNMYQEIMNIKQDLKEHERTIGHSGTIQQQATNTAKYKEIEICFENLNKRVNNYENWQTWWNKHVPSLNAAQTERIYRLEETVFGHSNTNNHKIYNESND